MDEENEDVGRVLEEGKKQRYQKDGKFQQGGKFHQDLRNNVWKNSETETLTLTSTRRKLNPTSFKTSSNLTKITVGKKFLNTTTVIGGGQVKTLMSAPMGQAGPSTLVAWYGSGTANRGQGTGQPSRMQTEC